jgi:hypothetical protein
MAGALGVAIHDALIARQWLVAGDDDGGDYSVAEGGMRRLAALGVDVAGLRVGRRRLAFGCLDWSERRPHLGGALGAALLSTMLARRWATRERDSRALSVTALGRRELAAHLGVRMEDVRRPTDAS